MDYNKTINLPKTDFPMRAGLPKREPDMLQHWNDLDLYNELLKKNEGKPRFSLHDGPPFSNGGLHMGHALNKSIKDFITRSYAMRGYYTPYIPGWDNHGMPIESAIIKEQKLNRKNMSVAEFRSACHDYAQKYIDIQMDGFKRMGVLGDWEHPYKTMDPGFEAEEVKVFGAMYQKGYIYKGLKPVYWCPHDETALAEAEIEYQDDPCTTVYVKFPMADDQGKLPAYDRGFIDRLVKAAEQTDDYDTMRALASAMLSVGGGLRLIELQNAKVSNLDRRNATLKLDVVKGMDRYGKPRVVPLAPEIMPQMDRFLAMREEFLRDKPYKTDLFFFNSWDGTVLSDRFSYRYRKVVEEVIGEHFDFRGCRRTFSQNAADVGVSDESISVVMGHSTTRTTNLHYSRRPTSVALEEFDSVRNDKTRGNDHGTGTEGSGGNP